MAAMPAHAYCFYFDPPYSIAMPIDLQPPTLVALICAITVDSDAICTRTKEALAVRFGPIRAHSAAYPFDFTSYYAEEMGAPLDKQLICFAKRIDPCQLPHIKLQTMELERELGKENAGRIHRRANIDPGLLSIESLVLATSKHSGHRICIAPSLYAETTLLYQKNRYRPQPWTYVDYQSDLVQDFLLEMRTWLMATR
jgi:hypothetical protein